MRAAIQYPVSEALPTSSVGEALRWAVSQLQTAHIETASLDARLLLEYALGCDRSALLLRVDEKMSGQSYARYRDAIRLRAGRRPVSQIIGKREFFGLTFHVTESVLDPRPDSETLIDAVLRRYPDREAPLRILDLGVGSGCLLLTLLYLFPQARGVGVDISAEALKIAQENAARLGLQPRAQFLPSHWCMQVEDVFDVIVSNPPYIPSAEIDRLAPEVSRFEPRLALDGGEDGLSCYRAIIVSLARHLVPGGLAALEIGFGQQAAVEALVESSGLSLAGIAKDLQGIPRVILIHSSPSP